MKQLRTTTSICPKCFNPVKAFIAEDSGAVYLLKECKEHGKFRLLLSSEPDYYLELYDFFFDIMQPEHKQNDFILHLTNKCNLNCPICLANANEYNDDYPADKLKQFLSKATEKKKIDIMGAEPTMRDDIFNIIKIVKQFNHVCALHTNGIKLSDYKYCENLKNAGLDEIHLQYDTFNEKTDIKIRGTDLNSVKNKTLSNLEKLNFSTDIVMTVLKGINESEIKDIFNFFSKKKFVKEIFFLGHRLLGKTHQNDTSTCMMPDEVLDFTIKNAAISLTRQNMKIFQKLYFTMLSLFSKRKCFYIHHYLYFRHKDSVMPIDKILNMSFLDKILNLYRKIYRKNKLSAKVFILSMVPFTFRISQYLPSLAFASFSYLLNFITAFNLSKLSNKFLLIGFITACDPYSYDEKISANCGKGVISAIRGISDNGAFDNIRRDMKNNENISAD
jgi:uncharacterized radical SAM superfamily Fe-S cluster-containing enzyme